VKEVNVIRDDREKPENDRVHNDDAEAESKDDDRAEHKRKDGLQKEVKERENERDEDESEPVLVIKYKAGDKKVRDP
jgi:hypothetical protein